MLVDFNDIVDDGTLPAAVLAKRRADLRAETCTRFQLADVVKQVVASKVRTTAVATVVGGGGFH